MAPDTHPSREVIERLRTVLLDPVSAAENAELIRRVRLLSSLLLGSIVFIQVGLILPLTTDRLPPAWSSPDLYIFLELTVLLLILYSLNRSGHYLAAAWLTVAVFSLGVFAMALVVLSGASPTYAPNDVSVLKGLVFPLLLSSILLPIPATALVLVTYIAGMALLVPFFQQLDLEMIAVDPLAFVVGAGMMTLLAAYHRHQLEVERQAELAEEELRYRALLEATFEGIAILQDGTIIDANTGFAHIFGRAVAEVIGSQMERLIAQSERSAVPTILSRCDHVIETVGVQPSGTKVHLALIGKTLPYRGQEARVIAVQDITERKEIQDQLERQTRRLNRSNDELKQFFYLASHHLQEPLRLIVDRCTALKEQCPSRLEPNVGPLIDQIDRSAIHMREMINDLLVYFRIGLNEHAVSCVSVSATLSRVLSNLKSATQRVDAQVTRDDMPTVFANADQLAQVFQHLLINAVQYRSERRLKVHIGVEETEDTWIFSVADNGVGIDPAYHERIFRIFRQTPRSESFSGTGIGLAICKRIVERHNGKIWVESEPGAGSTFYFSIPKRRGGVNR